MAATTSTGSDTPDAPVAPAGADAPPPAAPGPARIHSGELLSAGSAVALLVVMFGMRWYGVAGVPDPSAARPAVSGTESGWEALSLVRWVVLATTVAAIGSVALHVSQRGHGVQTDTSRVVTVLGLVTSALLVYRVLIALPAGDEVIDQKLGALLGVACALGIALGGHQSILGQRTRMRSLRQRQRQRQRRAGRGGPPDR